MRPALRYYYYTSGGSDPSYQAVINYATAQGFQIPTIQQRQWENKKLAALKSSGAWDESDIIYNFATNGDLNYASINWKNPGTFQLTKSATTPYFIRKQGVQGDGAATIWLNTGWIAGTHGVKYTQNNAGVVCGVLTNVDDSGDVEFGASDASNADRVLLLGRSGANTSYCMNASTARAVANGSNSIGRYITKRVNSTTIALYKNGSSLDSGTVNSTGVPNVAMAILAENGNGTMRNFSGRRVSHCYFGSNYSGLEAAIDAIEAQFITDMSTLDPDEQGIFAAGNSITFGTGTTKGLSFITQTFVLLNRPLRLTNIAIAGYTTAQMAAQFPASYTTMTANDVFILFGGTNDVLASTATATSWSNLQALINNVKGLGVTKIVVGTLMDCSTYDAAQDTLRDDLNTLIRDNAVSMGYVVADYGANVNLATHSATYYDDTVHPNNAGAAIMASIASAAIDTLI